MRTSGLTIAGTLCVQEVARSLRVAHGFNMVSRMGHWAYVLWSAGQELEDRLYRRPSWLAAAGELLYYLACINETIAAD